MVTITPAYTPSPNSLTQSAMQPARRSKHFYFLECLKNKTLTSSYILGIVQHMIIPIFINPIITDPKIIAPNIHLARGAPFISIKRNTINNIVPMIAIEPNVIQLSLDHRAALSIQIRFRLSLTPSRINFLIFVL
jgi:hypothetical protein